jgi:hypothetical protein
MLSGQSRRSKVPARSVADFRFYEELNDFLRPELRKRTFSHAFNGSPAIKDVIEAIGVPHAEIDLVLIDGESVNFARRLRDGNRVAVYPVFERIDLTPLTRLRPRPLRRTRFVLDVHLGTLARYLRLLGFDSLYRNDYDDHEIVRLAHEPVAHRSDQGQRAPQARRRHARPLDPPHAAGRAAARDTGCIRSGGQRTPVHALRGMQRSLAPARATQRGEPGAGASSRAAR